MTENEQILEELRALSDDELNSKKEDLINDIIYMEEVCNDSKASTEQKSEFINTDIKDDKKRIGLIEQVINERGTTRRR